MKARCVRMQDTRVRRENWVWALRSPGSSRSGRTQPDMPGPAGKSEFCGTLKTGGCLNDWDLCEGF